MPRAAAAAMVLLLGAAYACTPTAPPLPPDVIQANDQTRPVGTLKSGVLTVHLETRIGKWRPEGDSGRVLDHLVAFAEVGGAASTPGPLMRMPLGTEVEGTLHNTLGRPLVVVGLRAPHRLTDSLVIPADSTVAFAFKADRAGTFVYAAATHADSATGRDPTEMQLNGAIVVDRPGAPVDRILGISWFYVFNPKSRTGIDEGSMAINGLSWPHTERLRYTQGDSIHWQVINFTEADHPMHLHGFYFRVEGREAEGTDTVYAADQQRMAVTEVVQPFQSVRLSWQADRPGNWVFHCHYALHVSDLVSLDTHDGALDSTRLPHHASDRPHQMFGLVMGITVQPKGPQLASTVPERRIRLIQRSRNHVYGEQPGLSYLLVDSDGKPADTLAMPVPAAPLILERGKRVAVTIVNQSMQHAAVHWHGIELESYPDGVPGWSGDGKATLPSIAPHESLTVRWTPPRAGSFMYHSHFNESRQMGGGLYGPIIVLDSGARFDPETDRIFFFGTAGSMTSFLNAPPAVLLNGSAHPPPMEFKAGTTYRLRFFNLAGDSPTFMTITQLGKPVEWRALAKDGYPLPSAQATVRPAMLMFDPGEIYDFEFTPAHTGEYSLAFGFPQPPPAPKPKPGEKAPPAPTVPPLVHVAVHVR